MDELELRRRCYAEPNSQDPEYRQQLSENPAAERTAANVARFDQSLKFALRQPAVPEGLAGRILLRANLEKRRQRQKRYAGFAMAASVVLAVTVSVWTPPMSGEDFPQMAMKHVYDEIHHLHEQGEVNQASVAHLFSRLGGTLTDSLGKVHFASFCPTPKGRGLHLVMDGEQGRVTVLYVPGADFKSSDVRFGDQRFEGRSIAMQNGGTLAVIGNPGESLDQLAEKINRSIQWAV